MFPLVSNVVSGKATIFRRRLTLNRLLESLTAPMVTAPDPIVRLRIVRSLAALMRDRAVLDVSAPHRALA